MAMIRCPKCNKVHAINRAGFLRGIQRYVCKACRLHFTLKDPVNESPRPDSRARSMATIGDIAKALQISKSTVSRALRRHEDINPQTRDAVLKMARELDYTPNLLAQSLVRSCSNTIGIIVPELISYFFPTVIIGATEVASQAGYTVIICHSQESLKTEVDNVNALLAGRADGVMISMTRETHSFDHFKSFERHGIPMVFYNRVCEVFDCPKVLVNDYEGAFKATEHLIQSGYRRIAHIGGPLALGLSNNRLNGYKDALKKYGLPVRKQLILHTELSTESVRGCAERLLAMRTPPDAVFCVNDPSAIQLMMVAKRKGIRIPDQLGVVGFSNDPMAAVIEPGLTTVAQPVADIGRVAMQALIDRIRGAQGAETKYLNTELIVRGSSRKG